jgi:hypothetical protein
MSPSNANTAGASYSANATSTNELTLTAFGLTEGAYTFNIICIQ